MKQLLFPSTLCILAVILFFKDVFVSFDKSQRNTSQLKVLPVANNTNSEDYNTILTQTASLFGVEYTEIVEGELNTIDESTMLKNVQITVQMVKSIDNQYQAIINGSFDGGSEKHEILLGDKVYGFYVASITPTEIVFKSDEEEKTIKVFKPDSITEVEDKQ